MNTLFLCRLSLLGCLFFIPIVNASEHPELSRWLDDVLSQHPELQAASAGVDVARAQGRAAGQPLYNPEFELDFEDTDIHSNTVGISQTIDWGNKRSSLSRIASYELVAAKARYQLRYQNLAISLLTTLAHYQTNLAIKQVSDKRYQLMSRFATLAQQRRKAGDLSQIELNLAKLATAEAGFQRANAEVERIDAQQALTALTGEAINKLPKFPSIPESRDYPAADKDQLIDSLPAMRIARAQMDMSRAQVQLRQREQWPDPSFGLRAGKEGKEKLTGLTLSIPLYVRNNFQAEVDVANAVLIQKQREAISVRRQLDAKLTASVLSYQVNRGVWLDWQTTGKQSLQQQGQLLDRLWRVGELSTTDYLVQLKQALDTEVSAFEQRGHMWQTWINWLAASGEIKGWLRANEEQL